MSASLRECPRLRALYITDAARVPGATLSGLLRSLPCLESLGLVAVAATGDVVASICGLRGLVSLNLNGATELSNEALASIARSCTRLASLNVVDTPIAFGGVEALLEHATSLKRLAIDAEPEVVHEMLRRRPDLAPGLFDFGAAKRAICEDSCVGLARALAGHGEFVNTLFRARLSDEPDYIYTVSLLSLSLACGGTASASIGRTLLRLGADPNLGCDARLNLPLLHYTMSGDVRMVGELLQRGARPNALSGTYWVYVRLARWMSCSSVNGCVSDCCCSSVAWYSLRWSSSAPIVCRRISGRGACARTARTNGGGPDAAAARWVHLRRAPPLRRDAAARRVHRGQCCPRRAAAATRRAPRVRLGERHDADRVRGDPAEPGGG